MKLFFQFHNYEISIFATVGYRDIGMETILSN